MPPADIGSACIPVPSRTRPCIVHLDNGYDNELYTWFFNELKANGGKWDMIGMSLYPYWTMLEHKEYTADRTITECIANINSVARKYNCDVMVVETGMECADDKGNLASASVLAEGKRQLARVLKELYPKGQKQASFPLT